MKKHTYSLNLLSLVAVILFTSQLLGGAVIPRDSLPYAEGGPESADPGASLDVPVFYIDPATGDDSNSGTKAQPWRSMSPVLALNGNVTPGTHFLFKRGQTITSSRQDIEGIHGSEGLRVVYGAYGDAAQRPVFERVRIFDSSWLMVRDLDLQMLIFDAGSNNSIAYSNEIHGAPGNSLAGLAGVSKLTFARNLVYDVSSSSGPDAIVLHSRSWNTLGYPKGPPGSHHWIIGNTVIGNTGFEQCVDIAAESKHLSNAYTDLGKDMKVVGNRMQTQSLEGDGICDASVALGHDGRYIWVVGNIGTAGKQSLVKTGPWNRDSQNAHIIIQGNIWLNPPHSAASGRFELNTDHFLFRYNTVLRNLPDKEIFLLRAWGDDMRFFNNLLISPQDFLTAEAAIPSLISQMDNNWYGSPVAPMFHRDDWTTWQTQYGLDQNSAYGEVSGVDYPDWDQWLDPRTWDDPAFLEHFKPDPAFAGFQWNETPGAITSDGKWQGLSIDPMEGLENNGYGWEGPSLVHALLVEMGVVFEPVTGTEVNGGGDNETSWGGYPMEAGDSSVYAGEWLGWLTIPVPGASWIYSWLLMSWIYLPEPAPDAAGAWAYVPR